MNNTLPIIRLADNRLGKDYVVGDLHGCIDLLRKLLTTVNFDYQRDRLFSVGDMVDRGIDSLACLALLTEPWFYAVQGNHEQMLIDFFWTYLQTGKIRQLTDDNATGIFQNGGDWLERYFLEDKQTMTVAFTQALLDVKKLPCMYIVGEQLKRFHVIHAELVRAAYRTTGQMVWLDADIDNWLGQKSLRADIEERLLRGRTMMSNLITDKKQPRMQQGLSLTFCGHTYDVKPRLVLSHLCVDTGAFASRENVNLNGLSLFDVQASTVYSFSYSRDEPLIEQFLF